MRWYVEPAFAQQRDFNSRVLKAVDELSERIDAVSESLVVTTDELRTSADSVSRLERSLTEQEERLLHVERRTRRQGKAPAAPPAPDAPFAPPAEEPDYFAFESRMRGSSELIRDRQSAYLDEFREYAPVLDIGCGRGEFVSLLREARVEARGIDTNADMVAHCRTRGCLSSKPTPSAISAASTTGRWAGSSALTCWSTSNPLTSSSYWTLQWPSFDLTRSSSPRRPTRSASSLSPTSRPTCRTSSRCTPRRFHFLRGRRVSET